MEFRGRGEDFRQEVWQTFDYSRGYRYHAEQFGLNRCDQDEDFMFYSINEFAFPCGRPVPESYSGEVLRIDSRVMDPGYTKLIRELDNTEHVQQRDSSKQYHGPAEISYYTGYYMLKIHTVISTRSTYETKSDT